MYVIPMQICNAFCYIFAHVIIFLSKIFNLFYKCQITLQTLCKLVFKNKANPLFSYYYLCHL